MNGLEVVVVERSRLADILRGVGGSVGAGVSDVEGRLSGLLSKGSVGVGYCDGHSSGLPHFIVIPGVDRREFFAWVNTFCPFVTPLSQWCRVVTQRELADAQGVRRRPEYGGLEAAWAGAAIGEAVLHMGTGAKVAQLSTAALHTCATFVAARVFGLWEDRKLRGAAMERLGTARGILGGSERGGPSEYERAWDVLEKLADGGGRGRQGALWGEDWTVKACKDIRKTGFVSMGTMDPVLTQLEWAEHYREFESVGAEQRLRIFDGAVECLGREREHGRSVEALGEFMVGYFAARIGGGPSGHLGLLEKVVGQRPMVAVWYGIASALYRPEVWGAEFGGLGRLAVRELAFPWRFADPPRCDIAVDELTALVERGGGSAALGFRGAMRRVLNVEVALGVNAAVPLALGAEDDGGVPREETARGELADLKRHLTAANDSARRLDELYGTQGGGTSGAESGGHRGRKRSRPVERKSSGRKVRGNGS